MDSFTLKNFAKNKQHVNIFYHFLLLNLFFCIKLKGIESFSIYFHVFEYGLIVLAVITGKVFSLWWV